ncbi:MAG: hypothetical protein M3O15_07145 [Acidobacteriota bacterium]|nr:hypothetical protein [Acidobacteriota bacterium]
MAGRPGTRLVLALAAAFPILGLAWIRLVTSEAWPRVRVGVAATDTTVRCLRTERKGEAQPVAAAYARWTGVLANRGAWVVGACRRSSSA